MITFNEAEQAIKIIDEIEGKHERRKIKVTSAEPVNRKQRRIKASKERRRGKNKV